MLAIPYKQRLTYMPFVLLLVFLISCTSEVPDSTSTTAVPAADTLREFKLVVDANELLLDSPVFMKMDPSTGHLFLYDNGPKTIFELDKESKVINRFGGSGGGPGELSKITGLYVSDSFLYAHDPQEFFIHRYNRENGEVTTYNYGQRTTDLDAPPTMGTIITNHHPSNSRTVTLDGNILRPSHEEGEYLYELIDWEGNHLADIAPLPESYQADLETEAYRQVLENGEVPATDLHRVFPVADRANPNEIFLVYSANPKIEKYDMSGNKLWEVGVPPTPEMDTLRMDHLGFVQAMRFTRQIPMRKYAWGTSGPDGALFLATYTNLSLPVTMRTLWVHRFGADGELTHRFALPNSEETILLPFIAVDTETGRILTVSMASGEIRAYPFEL
ncbi:MAG: hypothetical protein U5K31_10390 [Balneolaceae bacterium]|nr:hypothetical protein [Balneolaceae bacterium]